MNRFAMPLRPLFAHILALSIAATTALTASAQNSTWNWPNYNSATSWNATGSWIGGIPTASNTAIFSNFGDQIVTVATGQLTGGITFSSPGAFTNDYYFTAGTLLPSNNAIIQTDSTYRGIANFNTAPTLQGNLTLSSNGQATSGLFFGGAVGTAASLGSITLTLTGTHSNFAALGTQTQPLGHGPNNVLSGVISNASGTTLKLVKSGTGSWILGGTNTYTGGTDLNGGTLYVASAQALGTTGTVSVLGNTTLRIANSHTGSVLNDISGRLSIADDTTFTYDTQSVSATGFGTSAWAGPVATSGGSNTAGFTKAGLGELMFTFGANATAGTTQTWRGDTTINAGNLFVNLSGLTATDRTNLFSSASRLVLGGGALRWQGRTGNTTTQTFNGALINPGVSQIIMASGSGTNVINLGNINRSQGGLLNLVNVSGFTINTTSTNNAAGALKGVLYNVGNDFARVVGGTLQAASYNVQNNASLWTNLNLIYLTNATVTGEVGSGGTTDIGGLKMTFAGNNSFSINGTLRTSNGILFGSTIGNNHSEISGGNLTSTSGDLIIVNNNAQNNYTRNTINSRIVDNGSPTDVIFYSSGAGSLFISGNNTYTGNTTIGGGQNNVSGISLTVIGGAAGASIGSSGATVLVNGGTGGANNVLRVGNADATGDVKGTIDLVNGRLSLNRTDAFTLSATVRGTTGAGSISQDSTGNATVNLASGDHLFQSIGSTAAGTMNLAGSGTYTFLNGASAFNLGSTTNFNSGNYIFGATPNSGANSSGNWNINGANIVLGGGRYFNSAGGNVTLNAGSFRANGQPASGAPQTTGNILYNVTGGTFIAAMASNSGVASAFSLGGGSPAATGSSIFNQSGGSVNIGVPDNANTSSTAGLGLHIGVSGSTHNSTYNLSGGTLRVFGSSTGIAVLSGGAPGVGGSNNFNWTGGTLTTVAYNGAFLNSSSINNTLVQDGATTVMSPGDFYEGIQYTGRTAITGNYQINSGTVAIGLNGTTAAGSFHETSVNRYDQITVSGATTLGGRLALTTYGYTPPSNTSTKFDILVGSASGITGSFTNGMVAQGGNTRVVLADGLSSMLVAVNNTGSNATVGGLTDVQAYRVAVGGYQATNTYNASTGSSWDAANAASWSAFDAGSSTGASSAIAQFADGAGTSAGANVVNLTAVRNIRGIQLSSTTSGKSYTLNGTGALIFDNTANGAAATIADSTTANNTINLGASLNSNLTVTVQESAATLTMGGNISGSGTGLTKVGNGRLVLSGTNTFNGSTTIAAGTLTAASTGALGSTSSVTISGATLEIAAANAVNDSASITLANGTIAKGSGVINETFGALILVSNSNVDFGGGTGSFTFATFNPSAFKLKFLNFNVGNSLTVTTGLYNASQFDFNGFETSWSAAPAGGFTITAIPEPSAIAAAVAFLGLAAFQGIRRRRKTRRGTLGAP